jgi:hypothetical protein
MGWAFWDSGLSPLLRARAAMYRVLEGIVAAMLWSGGVVEVERHELVAPQHDNSNLHACKEKATNPHLAKEQFFSLFSTRTLRHLCVRVTLTSASSTRAHATTTYPTPTDDISLT